MSHEMNNGTDYKYIPVTSKNSGTGLEILPDIYMFTVQISNIYLVGNDDCFVIVDTGMPKSGEKIISAIENKFGKAKPKAIILTHGHFDHVGGAVELLEKWDIPLYAHKLELPFLKGEESYPQPDATAEGGMVAKMSPLFPVEPIDLGSHVHSLPSDGTVPFMEEFRWIHTPGHSPGHVSFFREADKTLIAGDAFITVKQDELYKVLKQEKELNGPPRYLTTDWKAAEDSVRKLRELHPTIAVTGHGVEVSGEELSKGLDRLVANFQDIAVPDYGKYVE